MSIGTRALRAAGAATIALATVSALTLGAAGSAAADPAVDAAVDLPLPFPSTWTDPVAVNDSGVIVGTATNTANQDSAVRWSADLTPTVLPRLPGDTYSRAAAVSDDGTAFGYSGNYHPVRWAPDGTVTPLPLLPEDAGGWGYIYTASRTGVVVGSSEHALNSHGVIWTPDGRVVRLAPLAGDVSSQAVTVNSSGESAGVSRAADGTTHPVKWRADGTPVALDPAHAYNGAWVVQINDAGTVLARSATPVGAPNSEWRSLTWSATGTVTDLGRQSSANAINASGTVVGKRTGADGIDYTATRWSPGGTATTIGSAYEYTTAVAVNDAGVSVGYTGVKVPSDQHRYALRYEADGSLTELNVLPETDYSFASFVTNSGLTVGVRVNGSTHLPVIWRP
ncbi:hypothetical protein ACIBCA_00045 [Kitasatospora sp. NPDC051170]|uniref:hypothetical protein n=1 Tax=Kitasatospora sp. NPDC051170 TaxID=3364056 RepID=UPI0037BAC730